MHIYLFIFNVFSLRDRGRFSCRVRPSASAPGARLSERAATVSVLRFLLILRFLLALRRELIGRARRAVREVSFARRTVAAGSRLSRMRIECGNARATLFILSSSASSVGTVGRNSPRAVEGQGRGGRDRKKKNPRCSAFDAASPVDADRWSVVLLLVVSLHRALLQLGIHTPKSCVCSNNN